jgi:hypothetical protein
MKYRIDKKEVRNWKYLVKRLGESVERIQPCRSSLSGDNYG